MKTIITMKIKGLGDRVKKDPETNEIIEVRTQFKGTFVNKEANKLEEVTVLFNKKLSKEEKVALKGKVVQFDTDNGLEVVDDMEHYRYSATSYELLEKSKITQTVVNKYLTAQVMTINERKKDLTAKYPVKENTLTLGVEYEAEDFEYKTLDIVISDTLLTDITFKENDIIDIAGIQTSKFEDKKKSTPEKKVYRYTNKTSEIPTKTK